MYIYISFLSFEWTFGGESLSRTSDFLNGWENSIGHLYGNHWLFPQMHVISFKKANHQHSTTIWGWLESSQQWIPSGNLTK